MTYTATWTIDSLEREVSDGYVFRCNYRAYVEDSGLRADLFGSVDLNRPTTLIPYENLTEELCLEWLLANLDSEEKDRVEKELNRMLSNLVNPPVKYGLPWAGEE